MNWKIFFLDDARNVYKFFLAIGIMQEEENFDIRHSRVDSLKGFFRTFFWLSKEEWSDLDHKMVRIIFGVGGMVAMALFWLYFLRSITPF